MQTDEGLKDYYRSIQTIPPCSNVLYIDIKHSKDAYLNLQDDAAVTFI